MMARYAVIIEKGPTKFSYGAYVPDLPGCVAAAKSVADVKRLIREAIPLHVEGLRDEGEPVPEPTSLCDYMESEANQQGELRV